MKKIIAFLLTALMATSMVACGSKQTVDTSLDDVINKGEITVAISPDFAPNEFKDPNTGEIMGSDIYIAQYVADYLSKKYDTLRVVNDQIGTPTYTLDLSRLLVDMVETEKYGYYHATNEGGYISWYDFCCEFYRQYGLKTRVVPVTTEEYGLSKAARPVNSRLDKRKLIENGFEPLPTWQDAVRRYLEEAKL